MGNGTPIWDPACTDLVTRLLCWVLPCMLQLLLLLLFFNPSLLNSDTAQQQIRTGFATEKRNISIFHKNLLDCRFTAKTAFIIVLPNPLLILGSHFNIFSLPDIRQWNHAGRTGITCATEWISSECWKFSLSLHCS